MLTQARLKEILTYDRDTGIFTWSKRSLGSNSFHGKEAGHVRVSPKYKTRLIRVDGRLYRAHRLAWLYCYGSFPEFQIDHINGDSLDNRIENLRDVSQVVNMQNLRGPRKDNKLGLLGAHMRHDGKFIAQISCKGKYVFLGVFDRAEDASNAYLDAKRKIHEGCTI